MHFGMVIFVRDFPEKIGALFGLVSYNDPLFFFLGNCLDTKNAEPTKNHCKEILSDSFLAATFANKWIGNHPNHRICPEGLCLVSYFCSGTSLLMQQEMMLPIGTSLDFMGTLGALFRNCLYSWPQRFMFGVYPYWVGIKIVLFEVVSSFHLGLLLCFPKIMGQNESWNSVIMNFC